MTGVGLGGAATTANGDADIPFDRRIYFRRFAASCRLDSVDIRRLESSISEMTEAGGPTDVNEDLLMLLLLSPVEATGINEARLSGTLARFIRRVWGSVLGLSVCFRASIKISSINASLGP